MNHWLRWRPSFPLFTPNGCWCEQMKTARRSHQTHLFTLRQLQRTRASVLGGGRELGRSAATRPASWSVITLSDDPLITARQSAHGAGGFPFLCLVDRSMSSCVTSSTSTSWCHLAHLPAPDLILVVPIHSSLDSSIYRSSNPSIHASIFSICPPEHFYNPSLLISTLKSVIFSEHYLSPTGATHSWSRK